MNFQSGLLSKLAALAILLCGMLPLVIGTTWMLTWAATQTEQIDETLQQYDRFRSVAAFDPASLRKGFGSSTAPVFLGEGPQAVLTSSLQSRLREIAAQRGVEVLQAAELTPTESIPGLLKIGIRVEMSGPAQGLHGVLEQIEQSVPWLFLDNTQLRAGYTDPSQGEPPLSLGTDVWGVIAVTSTEPSQP
jgi:Type II secretion system (T2SS), protein M subtype b